MYWIQLFSAQFRSIHSNRSNEVIFGVSIATALNAVGRCCLFILNTNIPLEKVGERKNNGSFNPAKLLKRRRYYYRTLAPRKHSIQQEKKKKPIDFHFPAPTFFLFPLAQEMGKRSWSSFSFCTRLHIFALTLSVMGSSKNAIVKANQAGQRWRSSEKAPKRDFHFISISATEE